MSSSKTLLATAALSLLAGVNGHCLIAQPVPFDQSSLNNSPLNADGSDFPCKFGSGYSATVTKMNQITVGQSYPLQIIGGATHNGGSCQVSVTLDKTPTKSSQWKVVHSIIGGCPNNATGNAADVATYAGNTEYQYSLPKGMPNGQYTLAWSWLNHEGNREFYMNCAPIDVTGGGSSNDVYNGLPDMFVANLPPTSCATAEGQDFVYPDPGDSVQSYTGNTLGSAFSVSAGCASVTKLGAGAGSAGSPAQATASAGGSDSGSSATAGAGSSAAGGGMIGSSPTTAAAGSASASASSGANPGGVFAPGASSAATTLATSVAPVPAASSAPAAADPSSAAGSAAAPAASGTTGSSGAPEAGAVACTASGFYCIDANTFGMCANGYAVPQPVAAGTSCTSNQIDFAAGTQKKRESSKYARHFPRHAHMHRRHALGYDF